MPMIVRSVSSGKKNSRAARRVLGQVTMSVDRRNLTIADVVPNLPSQGLGVSVSMTVPFRDLLRGV